MNVFAKGFCLTFAFLLASCATEKVGEHSYYKGKCVDCYNNPLTGDPINYRKGEESINTPPEPVRTSPVSPHELPPAPTPCDQRVKFDVAGPLDVDTAYVRIKREFGYKTRDETLLERGISPGSSVASRNQWFDSGYRHEQQPGVRYLLSERVSQTVEGRAERGWLTLEISKEGKGSHIDGEYCNGGTDGFSKNDALLGQLKGEIRTLLTK